MVVQFAPALPYHDVVHRALEEGALGVQVQPVTGLPQSSAPANGPNTLSVELGVRSWAPRHYLCRIVYWV